MPVNGTVYGADGEDFEFEADFVSFVNHDTFGKPPIIAPGTDSFASASQRGDVTVLFVNVNNVVAIKATKTP